MSDNQADIERLQDLAEKARRMGRTAVDPLTRRMLIEYAEECEHQAARLANDAANDR